MSDSNKAAVRRFFDEAFNEGRFEVIDELVAPNAIDHDPQNPHRSTPGPEGVRAAVGGYRAAFSDLHLEIEQQFADGDYVITRWKGTGTHDGELMGIPATGRRSVVTGVTVDRFEGGRIAETWGNWDTLGMLQQLGVIPAQAAA